MSLRFKGQGTAAIGANARIGRVVAALPYGYTVVDVEFITGLYDEGFVRVGLHRVAVHVFGRAELTHI